MMSYNRWSTCRPPGGPHARLLHPGLRDKGNIRSEQRRKNEAKTDVKKQAFGKMPDGAAVDLYTLTNANGMQAGIMTYGGTVVSLTAPDRNGKYADVVLGLDDLAAYKKGDRLLRRAHRPLRQSHRPRPVHARRQDLQTARQR